MLCLFTLLKSLLHLTHYSPRRGLYYSFYSSFGFSYSFILNSPLIIPCNSCSQIYFYMHYKTKSSCAITQPPTYFFNKIETKSVPFWHAFIHYLSYFKQFTQAPNYKCLYRIKYQHPWNSFYHRNNHFPRCTQTSRIKYSPYHSRQTTRQKG